MILKLLQFLKYVIPLLVFTVGHSEPLVAELFEGKALEKPLSLEVEFDSHDYLLVTASQVGADYQLVLYENTLNREIRKVNIIGDQFLEEILIIDRSECLDCSVTLQATNSVDRKSPFSLRLTRLNSNEENKNLIEALSKIDLATTLLQKAWSMNGNDPIQYLEQAATELQEVVLLPVAGLHSNWRWHAMLLLANTQNELHLEKEQIVRTLTQIVDETEGRDNKYRAYAFFELGWLVDDIETRHELFNQGLDTSKRIDDKTAYAKGANYLSTSKVKNGDFGGVFELLNEVHAIYSSVGNMSFLIRAVRVLGWTHMRHNNMPLSIAYTTEAKVIAEQRNAEEATLWAMYYLAISYGEIGEKVLADQLLDEAIVRLAELPARTKSSAAILEGALLQEKTRGLLSYGALERASATAKRVTEVYRREEQTERVVDAIFMEGEIAMAQKTYSVARKKFLYVLEYDKKNNRVRSRGRHLFKLAELEMKTEDFIAASEYLGDTLRALEQKEDTYSLAEARSLNVELLYHQDLYEEALAYAIKFEPYMEEYGTDRVMALFAYRKALVEKALGQRTQAQNSLEKSLDRIAITLRKLKRRDLIQTYIALQRSVFELNIELFLEINPGQLLESLELVEEFRARTLRESLLQIKGGGAATSEQKGQRREILNKIQSNAVSWYGQDQSEKSVTLEDTRTLWSKLEKFESRVRDEKAARKTVKAMDVPVKWSSRPNELMLYYFIGEHRSWFWTIQEDNAAVHELPNGNTLAALTDTIISQISTPPAARGNTSAWQLRQSITSLSNILLGPIVELLNEADIDSITVIPDGALHGFPFSVLIAPGKDRLLLQDYPISYSPSIRSKNILQARSKAAKSASGLRALVVADPIETELSEFSFSRLPGSVLEASMLKEKFGTNAAVLQSENARRSDFLKQLKQPHSILHLATHGLLNNKEPALSGLIFSGETGHDLWLSPEISRAKIHANLVVLSACESSIGKQISGEGLFSLSRAFLEGGANMIVGALWKVQDVATAELMREFYSGLLSGDLDVSQALQQAQLATNKNIDNDWRDPYYWAGFQFQGSSGSVPLVEKPDASDL